MTQVAETTELLPEFFAVVAPGLEMLAANELLSYLPDVEIEVERGGFTFHASLVNGCELNRVLKIPTRLLLRLTSFGCRDFPKLFKKTMNFPWEQWVPEGVSPEFQASSHGSRLFVKKRIEETCEEGFEKRKKKQGVGALAPKSPRLADGERATEEVRTRSSINVLVRLDEDVCTISLDTSGEILHKRGTRALTAEAPIRETIAAALLFWMIAKHEDANAGAAILPASKPEVTLVDPMMGSGTFFLEAANLTNEVREREFAFESFPRYQEEGAGRETLSSSLKNPFTKFVGLDLDAKAIATTTGNLKPLMPQHEITAIRGDIFEAKALPGEERRWLIANPPYGERLKIEGSLKDYYERLFEACESFAQPERACFVIPETAKPLKLRSPRSWQLEDSFRFQNGGIPVMALQFIRK